MEKKTEIKKWRLRLFEILEVGHDLDAFSRGYDFIGAFAIVVNLAVSIMNTYDELRSKYGAVFLTLEAITVAFFLIDYVLRILIAKCKYPEEKEWSAIRKYVFSFVGIVDLLSFLPYYLPIFFPAGTVAFRMIRIVRIFRLFRINAYHDSFSVIGQVIYGKRSQLISSVFIILLLMIGSSLCMYSLEHEAQPEVFKNAFSGIWWATSTLLTVGYGDIYPITTLGRVFGIFIAFLGVGMVAIPTGIISAGFVDLYSSIKKRNEYGYEADMQFIKVHMDRGDQWIGQPISELKLPSGVVVAAIKREEEIIIPRGDVVLEEDDMVVIGAEPFGREEKIRLQEVLLRKQNPWVGLRIKELDISRQSIIVMVKRRNRSLIPNGNMQLKVGDKLFIYTKLHLSDANEIEI